MKDSKADNLNSLRPGRAELVLAASLVLVGLALRFAWPSRMAVEHFDEGVYSSNLWFDAEDRFRYPYRHLYAPPLFPALMELSLVLFGPSPLGTMLVSLLFGGLTIALVWWAARQWFGPEAALAAAALAALSDFHILFSRAALTDAMLGFWLLLAVYLIWEAFRTGRPLVALAAGAAAGLAWWTKYNGWLPLAVGLAGLLAWRLAPVAEFARIRARGANPSSRGSSTASAISKSPNSCESGYGRTGLREGFARWLLIALAATAVWSPVWFDLQPFGGYAAVAANHRGYLVGLSGWLDSFLQQFANHRYLEGWLSTASIPAALLAAAAVSIFRRDRFTWNAAGAETPLSPRRSRPAHPPFSPCRLRPAGLALAGCAFLLGTSTGLGALAIAGMAIHVGCCRRKPNPQDADSGAGNAATALAAWLLAAWFCGLLAATPFYRPYPRLTLPWLIAAWIASGAAIGWFVRGLQPASRAASAPGVKAPKSKGVESDSPHTTPGADAARLAFLRIVGVAMAAAALVLLGNPATVTKGVPGWQPRTEMERVAADVLNDCRESASADRANASSEIEFVVYVYAEPALFFHLSAAGVIARPVGDLEFARPDARRLGVPTFLVTGPHADRSPLFTEQMQRLGAQFQHVRTYRHSPSDLVLLDHYSPRRLVARDRPPEEEMRLYRLE